MKFVRPIQFRLLPLLVLTLSCVGTIYSQEWWTETNYEMDSIACASVEGFGDGSFILHYYDSTHSYWNTGRARIKYDHTVIRNDSGYIFNYTDNNLSHSFFSKTEHFLDWAIMAIENVAITYEESALHVTWDYPDSLILRDSSLVAKFHIFYAEAQIEHAHLLDSVLNWNDTYESAWEWEIGSNMYNYFFVIPKRVFPPYTSLIRIGIAGEWQYIDSDGYPYMSIYSRVSLAPDIYNKTPSAPERVVIDNIE